MKKIFTLTCLVFIIITFTQAQSYLKITKAKVQYWNDALAAWSGWPDAWTYYETGQEPVLKITKLDDEGYNFKMEAWINNDNMTFTVTYKEYDAANGWYAYDDANGDQITVTGSTLSALSMYGWPDSVVDIYFWIYSDDFAVVLE